MAYIRIIVNFFQPSVSKHNVAAAFVEIFGKLKHEKGLMTFDIFFSAKLFYSIFTFKNPICRQREITLTI